jgi:hypothetical protein
MRQAGGSLSNGSDGASVRCQQWASWNAGTFAEKSEFEPNWTYSDDGCPGTIPRPGPMGSAKILDVWVCYKVSWEAGMAEAGDTEVNGRQAEACPSIARRAEWLRSMRPS